MSFAGNQQGGASAAITQNPALLPPIEISQEAYSMFLLERSARQLGAGKYLQSTGTPERKLSYKDFLTSFKKAATENNIPMNSFDEPVTQFLVNVVRRKYSMDIKAYKGMKIRDMALHISANNFRVGEVNPNERRKTIIASSEGVSVA